jgi:hypothetical protein
MEGDSLWALWMLVAIGLAITLAENYGVVARVVLRIAGSVL